MNRVSKFTQELLIRQWDKNPVNEPGIIANMPIDVYHSAKACVEPSISSSGLRTIFNKSPKHYWAESPYNPKRIEDEEESEALVVGRAAHHLLFGQTNFNKQFAEAPPTMPNLAGEIKPFTLASKVCKTWWKDRIAEGLTPIKHVWMDRIQGMAESLQEEPLIQAGILNGRIEHSWIWKDRETGYWLKARPDASPTDSMDFADLKTTTDVSYPALVRTIGVFGYYQQAGLMAEACQCILQRPMSSFTLVFVEKKPPYCVAIVTLKPEDITRGIKANRAALKAFDKGLKTGKWLGPAGDVNDACYIEMSEYEQKRIDARLEMEGM
jgi:hypothetical protein